MNHILFLAMSTFPQSGYKANDFYVEGDDTVVPNCISQMEPVAKYMVSRYKEDSIHMVVLCTPETEEVMEKDDSDFKGEIPADFFESQMEEYSIENSCSKPIIHRIQLLLDNPYKGIAEAVDKIREFKKADPKGVFWIDPHGGFRDVALIMQAVVSLLKVDDIIPDDIFGIRYDRDSDKKNKIVPQRDVFQVFDFVTGMNDFINFGNADVLKAYFENGDETEQGIVGAIDKIAQGTQLCYPLRYRQGLNELGTLLPSMDAGNNTLLGLFKEYIENSYGKLLKSKTRTTLGIVKHCYEKKLYQQALTFIESDMPREIIEKGILTFGEENYQNEDIKKDAGRVDIKHHVFDTFITLGDLFYGKEPGQWHKHMSAIKLFSEYKVFYIAALEKRKFEDGPILFNINTRENKEIIPFDAEITINKKDHKTIKISKISTKYSSDYYGIIGIFLRLHRALKAARNLFNHANPEERDIQAILDAMELYLAYAEYLYKAGEGVMR